MIAFLDTEFTDLARPELLSIGAVTLDGREHYVELDMSTDIGKARFPDRHFKLPHLWTLKLLQAGRGLHY